MVTVIVLVLFFLTLVFDFLPNAKKRRGRENFIYCAILSAGFVILILYSVDIVVPGPTKSIRNIVELFVKPV